MLFLLSLVSAAYAAAISKTPMRSSVVMRDVQVLTAPIVNAGLKLTTTVNCGGSQAFSNVLVDTGSCLLWVGTEGNFYSPGPDSVPMNESFGAGYGSGSVKGMAYYDRVTVGDTTVNSQIIGAANSSKFSPPAAPISGIFGLGPDGCNFNEVQGNYTTPTFLQALVAEGSIEKEVFGFYVPPYDPTGSMQGEITFGGVDESRFTGDIVWVEQLEPVDSRYSVNVSSISYGPTVVQSAPYGVYTDSGNLYLGLSTDAFFSIYDTVPGAGIEENAGPLQGSMTFAANTSVDTLQPIIITFSNQNQTVDIVIPPASYLIPESLYASLNITDDLVHSWLVPGDLGQKFLENAYTAYDLVSNRIGFAALA